MSLYTDYAVPQDLSCPWLGNMNVAVLKQNKKIRVHPFFP